MPVSSPLPQPQPKLYDESQAKGLQLYTDPGNMRSGELLALNNMAVTNVDPFTILQGESPYGIRGGVLASRPGLQGQLAIPHNGDAIMEPLTYLNNGNSDLIYCAGPLGGAGGKLYHYVQNNTYDTEIKINNTTSFNFTTNAFRQARVGLYDYIIGNADGELYRTSLTSTGTTPGLAAPTVAPTVSLTNVVIDPMTSATYWSSVPALTWPGSTAVATNSETIINAQNQQFNLGTGSPSPYPTGWVDGGDSLGYQPSPIGLPGNEIYNDAGTYSQWADWDYATPRYYASGANPTNFYANARVWAVSVGAHSGNAGQSYLQLWPEDASETSQTLVTFSDLVIVSSAANLSTISSAGNPFQTADVNKVVTVFGGTGFILGNFTITEVNASTHVATVNGNIGTASSTGGIGTKNLDAAGTFGNSNFTLQTPPSAIPNAVQNGMPFTAVSTNTRFSNVFSFTSLTQDFDYVKFRIVGPAVNSACGVNTPSLRPVDVRLIPTATSSGLNIAANSPNGTPGGYCLGGNWIKKDYTSGASISYTDLAISGGNLNQVTSSAHPFTSGSVGNAVVITGGTNWISGTIAQILSVTSNVATLSINVATSTSATSGQASGYTVQDYSKYQNIFVGFKAPSSTPSGAIQWRFGFLQPGQPLSSIYWSNAASYTSDGSAFYCNISTIPAAILATTGSLYLQILSDLPATVNLANLCTLSGITGAGNLSIGPVVGGGQYSPVFYVITYINDDGDATVVNIIESDGSPGTLNLQPTVTAAVAAITLNLAGLDPTITHICVYRFGGVNVDGYGRIVATVPINSSFGYGADALGRDQSNPWVSWTYNTTSNTGTLLDNTPDSFLATASTYEQFRNTPPTGAQAIASWQGRVWLGVGSTLYGSWQIQTNIEAGIYFSNTALTTDPEFAIKGFSVPIAGSDDDPIQAIIPAPTGELLIFKQYSIARLTGTDPTNFQLSWVVPPASMQSGGAMGLGLAAPKAVAVDPVGQCVWFLAANGVWRYIGGTVQFSGTALKGVLNQQTINNPVTWANIAFSMHDLVLKIFVPTDATDTTNTMSYNFDTFTGCWSTSNGSLYQFTSAASLTATTDSNAIFYAGFDGQVYLESGWSDVHIQGGIAAPIPTLFQTRGLGRDDGGGTGRYTNTVPSNWYIAGIAGETVTLEVTVGPLTYNGATAPNAFTQSVTIEPSYFAVNQSTRSSAKGQLVTLSVASQTTNAQLTIQAFALAVAEGSV